jgi:hypothetical protein
MNIKLEKTILSPLKSHVSLSPLFLSHTHQTAEHKNNAINPATKNVSNRKQTQIIQHIYQNLKQNPQKKKPKIA